MKELSGAGRRLLIAAAEQGLFILHQVTWVRTGGRNFFNTNESDHAYASKYLKAFEELRQRGYVRHDVGIQYMLTDEGFKIARELAAEEKGKC